MPGYLANLQSLLWVDNQQLLYQILCEVWEITWPCHIKSADVLKHSTLCFSTEGCITCQELIKEHANAPDVDGDIVTLLLNHFRRKILRRAAV